MICHRVSFNRCRDVIGQTRNVFQAQLTRVNPALPLDLRRNRASWHHHAMSLRALSIGRGLMHVHVGG